MTRPGRMDDVSSDIRASRSEEDRRARIALASLRAGRDHGLGAVIDEQGVRAVALARARHVDVDAILDATARAGASIVVPGDAQWPSQLDDLEQRAPLALWVLGEASLRLAAVRSIAMVGARASTAYGVDVCQRWCGDLVDEGYAVVSGGALGIDAAAHRAALDCGGITICVLACGVDVSYPRQHEALLARIADGGVLVSEAPPGTPVRREAFLARNRLIPALTSATVVVEAAARSGTMSTANAAVALGRPLLAVPGPVTSTMSLGCLDLIATGTATLARDARDVLAAAQGRGVDHAVPVRTIDLLDAAQRVVLDELPARTGVLPDRIAAQSGLRLEVVLAALGALERSGWAARDSSGGWRVSRPSGRR